MSHFFAYLSRMKFIRRWGLMRNTDAENIQEHSHRVATIAHGLAIVRNRVFGGSVNAERVAMLGLYHDASEVITGDLATPIKTFNPEIKTAYKGIEEVARKRLLGMLPAELQDGYHSLFFPAEEEADLMRLVKAADKLCAYLKCIEERRAGNTAFARAEHTLENSVRAMGLPEVQYFLEHFVPSFSLTLDELN